MLKNLTIKSRLFFLTAFLSAQLVTGGVIGLVSLNNANEAMKSIYDDRLVPLGQLDRIVRMQQENQLLVGQAIFGDPEHIERQTSRVEANIKSIGEAWNAYMATYLTPEEKKLADEFAVHRKKFVEGGLRPAINALLADDISQAVMLANGPMMQLFMPVNESINALIQLQLDIAKSIQEESQSTYELVFLVCSAGILFGVILAALVSAWIIRSISRPLEKAIQVAGSVAAGDLTQKIDVDSKDEIGELMQALKRMNDSLVNIVSQVRTSTDTIATASSQIASGNMDLSSRTEQQASSLEETASSTEQLTSTVKQNADNARQANQLAATASDIAVKGGNVVSEVVHTMEEINESSKKIVDIISVIDGIAFQTNILALNAAVEAARAGEQGRGFAVVATEVRSLAQRSAAAAKEIKGLIGDSVEKVGNGSKLVNQAGATMEEIVASVRRVTDIMSEIMAASQEQATGIEQVSQAISQMDQVTQQNAALVEEAAAASQSMQDESANLAQVVGIFKLSGAAALAPAASKTSASQLPAKSQGKPVAAPAPRALQSAKKPAMSAGRDEEWEEF